MLICLPYESYFRLDAILRTSLRLLITRKRLLEWNPSDHQDHEPAAKLDRSHTAASWRSMWSAPVIAAATAVYLTMTNPAVLIVAAPILSVWFFAPAVAWWISRPLI